MDGIKKISASKEKEIVHEAIERFQHTGDASDHIRSQMLDDLKFKAGDQWPLEIRRERMDDGRPCLTINKLTTYIYHVVNSALQNKQQSRVRPADDDADIPTSQVLNGLMRHIQYHSDAESAFYTAFDYAVSCGMGFFRILTDYVTEDSFDQEIQIKRIDNPFTVHFPLHLCKEADFSDAPYCFVTDWVTKDEFKRDYPDADLGGFAQNTRGEAMWFTEDTVRVAEYFVVERESATLYQLQDGATTTTKPIDPESIVKQRPTQLKKIHWYKISGNEILDERIIPGSLIPVVPVLGPEINIEGKKQYFSLIRFAKDPQRLYNTAKSAEFETISLAPIAPFIVAEGQLEGYEQMWQTANRKPHAYLYYKPQTLMGQAVGAPQRVQPADVPSALINSMRESSDDIKATTGLFDASLGQRGNEISGRGIMARQQQGEVATYGFTNNFIRGLKLCAKIILGMIPTVYDAPRTLRILGEDMTDALVKVNQKHFNKDGVETMFDLSVGMYDVVLDSGPDFETKRQEASTAMMQFVQAYPASAQVAGDLIVKNMDFPGAQELAKRLKTMVPPQALEPGEATAQELQAAQGELEKLTGLVKALDEVVQKQQKEIDDKNNKMKLDLDKAVLQSETQLEVAKLQNIPNDIPSLWGMLTERINQMQMQVQSSIQNSQGPQQPMPIQQEPMQVPAEGAVAPAQPAADVGIVQG